MRVLLLIITGCFHLGTFAQAGVFHARFKSLLDGEAVMYAKVTSTSGNSRLTNSGGYVSFEYSDREKLTVTHLSFDTLHINPDDYGKRDTFIFYLTPRTFQLRELTYSVLGPRHTFDNRFVRLELEKTDEEKVKEKLNIEEMKGNLVALDQAAQDGMVLGSPITALYERFSKAAAERRAYEALIRRDLIDSMNANKFNDDIIRQLSGFSEEELQNFIFFCSFHENYIARTPAFDLYLEVLRCKREYLELEE